MKISIKTILILTLIFILMALFWSLIGRFFLDTSKIKTDNEKVVFKKATTLIVVENINTTIEFYNNVLGFEVLKRISEDGVYEFAQLKHGDAELILRTMGALSEEYKESWKNECSGSVMIYFTIENLNNYYKSLKDKCEITVDVYETDYGMKEFSIRDNNGYILIFGEEIIN